MTRRQALMAQALENVRTAAKADTTVRRAYGGLCHALPILVRRNGLCQTVAFVNAKSRSGSQQRAYALVCEHLAATLGQHGDTLLPYVVGASLGEYMQATRSVLMAWEFYKRFAVSVLGVESADAAEGPE